MEEECMRWGICPPFCNPNLNVFGYLKVGIETLKLSFTQEGKVVYLHVVCPVLLHIMISYSFFIPAICIDPKISFILAVRAKFAIFSEI